MEKHASIEDVPLEEYWHEFSSFAETCPPDEDDEDATKTPDEGEIEEEWLREAGLGTLVNDEDAENQVFNEILSTLTTRQREVVLKRLLTLELSKKKKKHRNRLRADVREVFSCINCGENSPPVVTGNGVLPNGQNDLFKDGDRLVVYKGDVVQSVPDEPLSKNLKVLSSSSSSSVIPPFLRTGHSGGFSLRQHINGIDTDSPTSVEVLKYETRNSIFQEKHPVFNDPKQHPQESNEISFQSISSRLDSPSTTKENDGLLIYLWRNHVPASEISEEDRAQVRSLSVIEVAALLDSHGIVPRRRRKSNRKKGKDKVVCGASITSMLELDRRRCPGLKIPLIYEWIFQHLHDKGLKEQGLLRLAGSVHKIEALKAECEKHYVSNPKHVENLIRQSSVYDVAVFLKQLVRQLPEPLLTVSHMDTFLQVPNVPLLQDQITVLNLLVLSLPDVHRDLLQELLNFLAKIVAFQENNLMSLSNVAMIIAPNLFPPPRLKKGHHHKNNKLETEVTVAALSSKVTELLVNYDNFLGMVPKELLDQAHLQSQLAAKKHAKKGKKVKKEKLQVIKEATNGHVTIIRVQLPSLHYLNSVPVTVNERTTAGDIIQEVSRILFLVTDSGQSYLEQENNLFSMRPRTESEPVFIHQRCHLGDKNSSISLRGHFLYHIIENIGERKLGHEDAVLHFRNDKHCNGNKTSSWEIRCHH